MIPEETKAVLLGHMNDGATMKRAAELCGVSVGTVQEWRKNDPDFAAKYKEAQEALSHASASDSVDLLLNTSADDVEDPKRAMAHVSIQREKSRALQWYASRLNPEQYGEKVEHRGQITQAVVLLPPLDPPPVIAQSTTAPQLSQGTVIEAEVVPD